MARRTERRRNRDVVVRVRYDGSEVKGKVEDASNCTTQRKAWFEGGPWGIEMGR